MLQRDGALTLMNAYEEMTLLEAEVSLIERAGIAAAVRADWLLAPATQNGWCDALRTPHGRLEPEGSTARSNCDSERLHPTSRLLDSEWVSAAGDKSWPTRPVGARLLGKKLLELTELQLEPNPAPAAVQAVVPDPGCAHVGQSVQTGCQWDPQQCSGPRNSRCCHWRGIPSGRYIGDIIRAIMAWYPRQTQLYLLIFFKQTVFIPN